MITDKLSKYSKFYRDSDQNMKDCFKLRHEFEIWLNINFEENNYFQPHLTINDIVRIH